MLSSGVFTAMVTPMDTTGQCDWETWDRLIARQKAAGVQGIVVHGTTGEGATLTADEKAQLLTVACQYQSHDFKIIAGVGSPSTQVTIEQAQQALLQGVDALMVVTPYYNCPTLEGLKKHYQAVDELGVPYWVYHVPKRTGTTLTPEALVDLLRALKHVVGVKLATGSAKDMAQCRSLLSEQEQQQWQWYGGDDPIFGDYLKAGASGIVSVSANAIPAVVLRCWTWAQSGQWEKVSAWQQAYEAFHQALFSKPNPILIKALLTYQKQLPSCQLRLPLLALPEQACELTHLLEMAQNLRIVT